MCTSITTGLEPAPAAIARPVAAIRTQLEKARKLERRGRPEKALAIARTAYRKAKRLDYRPLHAEALVHVACFLDARQTAKARREAEGLYCKALAIAQSLGHDRLEALIWYRRGLLAVRMDPELQKAKDHAKNLDEVVSRMRNCRGEQAKGHHLRGEIAYRAGNFAEAAREKQRAIDAISGVAGLRMELGRYVGARAKALEPQGMVDQAMALYKQAKKIASSPVDALGASRSDLVELHINYGVALKGRGMLSSARTELNAALRRMSRRHRRASLNAGIVHCLLSDVRYEEGKLDEALAHGRKSLKIYNRVGAPDHRRAEAYTSIANAELKRGNFKRAHALYEIALGLRQKLDRNHYQIGVNEGSLAEALIGLSRHDAAADHLREAERVLAQHKSALDWIRSVRSKMPVVLQAA